MYEVWNGSVDRFINHDLGITNQTGQLSLPFPLGNYIKCRPVWLGLRRGAFTRVRWQVTLCDSI